MTQDRDKPAPRVAFHIGYPKCASTTLQRALFLEHSEINSIGKPRHLETPEIDRLITAIRFRDGFQQSADPETRLLFDGLMDRDRLNVLSVEDFSVGPFWKTGVHKTADRSSIARTLHGLAPDAAIIVVMREQSAILKSIYAQLAASVKMPAFATWVDLQFDTLGHGSILDALRYKDLLDGYADLFGRSRIIEMDFTEIATDQSAAFKRLTNALGVAPVATARSARHNPRRSGLETMLRRLWKKSAVLQATANLAPKGLRQSVAGSLSKLGGPIETTYRPGQSDRLRDHFKDHNAALSATWNIGDAW